MKRLTMLAVSFAVLPLFAQEEAQKPAATAPQPVVQEESPLVAAARRANRLGKKPRSPVITNDTLVKANAGTSRITTTDTQPPIKLNLSVKPQPTPEMVAAEKAKWERDKAALTEKAKQAEEAKNRRRLSIAAERAEEGMYGELEDPDAGDGERDLQEAQSAKPPQI